MASGSTGSYIPRWTLAALIGTPIALGLGYLYYRKQASVTDSGREDRKKLEDIDKAVSIDDQSEVGAASVPEVTRLERAQKFKAEGNKHFGKGEYDKAITLYDRAIEECPVTDKIDLATFYQNRAAAYEQLGAWTKVIGDCTKALDLNQKYVKALQRRARAYEKNENYEKSLEDITAVCILQSFSNQTSLVHADRVLKALGLKHAKEILTNRKPVKPSKHFVKNYFASFLHDPIVHMSVSSGDSAPHGFVRAKLAFDRQEYDDIIPACTEEIESPNDDTGYRNAATLLRATFNVITGRFEAANKDLGYLLSQNDLDKRMKVNAYIKLASLEMQTEKGLNCFVNFTKAEEIDPTNSDLYHHRGQVFTLLDQLDNALADFTKAVELSPDHGITYVHKCYAEYRIAVQSQDRFKLNQVMEEFSKAVDKFPDCVECYSLMAQILSDQGQFGPADSFFERACKIDKENATILVHRGLLQLQWNGNIEEALRYINDAIKLDDKCEFAYETLGTIEVQRGNLENAVKLFNQAIELAKSEMELIHLCSLKDAAIAQMNVAKKFGIDIQSIAEQARSNSEAFMPA